MEYITIPDIYCPFPSLISPYVEKLHQHCLRFAKQFHLVQQGKAFRHFSTCRFAWFVARVYPFAEFDDLTLIADWNCIFFLFDNQLDEGNIRKQPERIQLAIEHLIAIMSDPSITPQSPIAEAFADFWQRTVHNTNPDWQRRFIDSMAKYLFACLWQAQNHVQGHIPDVDTYVEKRRLAAATLPVLDLIDIALRITLPPHVYESQELQSLRLITANMVCWVNDLYSLPKELAHGDTHNLVVILQHAHKCSLDDAIYHTCRMIEDEVRLFIDIEQHLPHFSP
ncbi:MAG TPA: hypothetical protein VGL94_13730, partial [Ktedonobacteraceae bacterium]